MAYVTDPASLNAVLTERFRPFFLEPREVFVHPAAFAFEPQGNRLVVVPYPKPEAYAGIHIPESARESGGLGVVLSCGVNVGIDCPHPGGPDHTPASLLYKTVAYGNYSGKAIGLDYRRSSEFNADILVVADRDIWCVFDPSQYAEYEVPNDFLRPRSNQ